MTVLTNKGGFEVGYLGVLAAIGMLALAGGCGYVLAWLEKKAEGEKREIHKERR